MGKGEALPMIGGEGQYSYYNNSTYQKNRFLGVKDMVHQAILDKLDVPVRASTIRIADLGCSVGPNTFYIMQTIAGVVSLKSRELLPSSEEDELEIQIFFNDQVGNDFNMLFSSMPSGRSYWVAAVPGSFYSRLFPRASIHCFNCSLSLHWLSKAPDGVANKGRVHCNGGGPDVLNAYIARFKSDATSFLSARAEELGKVKEEELDSFQVPIFAPSIEEFKEVVEKNGCFTIHVAEHVNQGWGLKGGGDEGTEVDLKQLAQSVGVASRAVYGEIVSDHFGRDILEELFQRFPGKVYQHFTSLPDSMPSPPPTAFFVLQKKPHSSA